MTREMGSRTHSVIYGELRKSYLDYKLGTRFKMWERIQRKDLFTFIQVGVLKPKCILSLDDPYEILNLSF